MIVQVLGLLALLMGVATVWLAITKTSQDQDPDAKFWYGFTGFCVAAPMLLVATLSDRGFGALAVVAVVAACLVARRFAHRTVEKQEAATAASLVDADHDALRARQDSVLGAWSRYELDAAAAIEFPAMHDVRVPEVSALAHALAEAELLSREARSNSSGRGTAGYRQAVGRLEKAFQRAEQAILNPAEATGARSSGSGPA